MVIVGDSGPCVVTKLPCRSLCVARVRKDVGVEVDAHNAFVKPKARIGLIMLWSALVDMSARAFNLADVLHNSHQNWILNGSGVMARKSEKIVRG